MSNSAHNDITYYLLNNSFIKTYRFLMKIRSDFNVTFAIILLYDKKLD